MSILHPGAAAVQRFAEGDTSSREHPRLVAHLASCQRCRSTVGSIRDLSAAARMLPVPAASPQLIDRILGARARGDRVILPRTDDRGARRLVSRRVAAGLMLCIGGAGYLAWDGRSSSASADAEAPSGAAPADSVQLPTSTPGLFISRLILPATAEASQPSTFPSLKGLDGRRLKAGQYFFSRIETTAPGARARTTGSGVLRVLASTDAGVPSWRVEYQWNMEPGKNGVRLETESLVVRQRDLRPISRTVHVAPYLRYSRLNISQRFAGDSVSGTMSAEIDDKVTVRRPIARPLAPGSGPYVSEATAVLMLSAVRLHANWAASFSLLGWAVVPDDVRYPVQLRVTGEDRVRVPAGEFDCWRLAVTQGTIAHTYWVRKSDGLGVRTRIDRPRSSGSQGNHEIVLTREVR